MSLPDTIFIFVLALIIFGPKKLPEIGRQIGRLVGEFRRASNEFKFQIEEELRLVDLNDKKTQRQSISAASEPESENRIIEESQILDGSAGSSGSTGDLGEAVPVGQHPNIAHLDVAGLKSDAIPAAADDRPFAELSDTPHITASEGSEPRNTVPYAYTEAVGDPPTETQSVARDGNSPSTDATSLVKERDALQPSLTHVDANHG